MLRPHKENFFAQTKEHLNWQCSHCKQEMAYSFLGISSHLRFHVKRKEITPQQKNILNPFSLQNSHK